MAKQSGTAVLGALKLGMDAASYGKVEGMCERVVTTTCPVMVVEKGKDPRRELVTVVSSSEARVAYCGVNGHTVLVEEKPDVWEPLKAVFAKGGDVEFFKTGVSDLGLALLLAEEAKRMKEMQQTAAAVRAAATGKPAAGLEVIQGGQA